MEYHLILHILQGRKKGKDKPHKKKPKLKRVHKNKYSYEKQEVKPINKIKLAFWIGAIAGAVYMIIK